MSDADRVREAREAVREHLVIDARLKQGYVDDILDAYAAALRAERDTAWRAAIEGLRMKQPNALNCTARLVIHTAAWNAAIDAALASTRHTQGEGT